MMYHRGGKLVYCTGAHKDVYAELLAFPYLEISVSTAERWLRIRGKAVWIESRRARQRVIEESPLVKSIYKDGDNSLPVSYTHLLHRLCLFPLRRRFGDGDLGGDDEGIVLAVDTHRHDDGGLLNIDESEVVGKEKEDEQCGDSQIIPHGVSACLLYTSRCV